MKIKDGYVLKEVAGGFFAVPVGEESFNANKMITVNGSAKVIWEMLGKDVTETEILAGLLDMYDVDEEELKKDITVFLDELKNADLIEE